MSHRHLKRTQADSQSYNKFLAGGAGYRAPLPHTLSMELPMSSVDRNDFIPIFEGGLDAAKSAAAHLKAEGIGFDIGMTDGSNPGS